MFFWLSQRALMILLCSLMCATVYANTAPTTVPVVSDPTQTILVKAQHPFFIITLAAKPSTGYSWHLLNYDAHLLSLTQHAVIKPSCVLPGAGIYERWFFKVHAANFTIPQKSTIALRYAKAWDLKDHSRRVNFTIVTQP